MSDQLTKAQLLEVFDKKLDPDLEYGNPDLVQNNTGRYFIIGVRKPEPPKTRGQLIAEKMVRFGQPNVYGGAASLYPHERQGCASYFADNDSCNVRGARQAIAEAIDAACAEAVKEEREACAKIADSHADRYGVSFMVRDAIRARSLPTDAGKGE